MEEDLNLNYIYTHAPIINSKDLRPMLCDTFINNPPWQMETFLYRVSISKKKKKIPQNFFYSLYNKTILYFSLYRICWVCITTI